MIKLGRLYLRNFKSFYSPFLFDFFNKDLVLLDGPNGFGKTTIFDAIELCFRREIQRLIITDDKQKDSHALKYKSKEVTIICLELIDVTIQKKYSIYIKIPPSETKTLNKIKGMQVERFILKEFPYGENIQRNIDSEYNNFSSLLSDEQNLESIFRKQSPVDFNKNFNIFNYIQQEETTHFLKQNEAKRHEIISTLFGAGQEAKDLEKLEDVYKDLKDNRLKSLEKVHGQLLDQLAELGESSIMNYAKYADSSIAGSGKIMALQVLSNKTSAPDEMLQNFKDGLLAIQWLLEDKDRFLKLEFNHQLDILLNQKNEILRNFLYVGTYDNYSEIKCNIIRRENFRQFKSTKNKFEEIINRHTHVLQNNLTATIIDFYCEDIKQFESLKMQFSNEIELLNLLNRENDSYEKLLSTLIIARENLNQEYCKLVKEEDTNPYCPYCGIKKESIEQLQEQYKEQSEIFKRYYSETTVKLLELNNLLKEKLLTPIVKRMNRYISLNKSFLLKELILNKQIINEDSWGAVQTIKNWLEDNRINYIPHILKKTADDSDLKKIDDLLIQLKASIEYNRKPIDPKFDYNSLINIFKLLGVEYIDQNIQDISIKQPIITSDLEIDIEYIQYLKAKNTYSSYIEKNEKINNISEQKNNLEKVISELKSIIDIYRKQIRAYELKVAANISIPFYVYSAKILQTRLEGDGIFLDLPEQSNHKGFIRFCSSAQADQDAWNIMSSGQLSGLIISFMLAMNKVYPTKLKVLLIDDPIQTMDEINMVSLMQLFRYEFFNYQLVMSTHERHVSDYFEYKYRSFDKTVKNINLRNYKLSSTYSC